MSLTVTKEAADWIHTQLRNRGSGVGVRIAVKTSGCTGFAYVLEFVDTQQEFDVVFESNGVTVFSDEKSLVMLKGTEVRFTRQGLNTGLEFVNPNVTAECGCGESFSV